MVGLAEPIRLLVADFLWGHHQRPCPLRLLPRPVLLCLSLVLCPHPLHCPPLLQCGVHWGIFGFPGRWCVSPRAGPASSSPLCPCVFPSRQHSFQNDITVSSNTLLGTWFSINYIISKGFYLWIVSTSCLVPPLFFNAYSTVKYPESGPSFMLKFPFVTVWVVRVFENRSMRLRRHVVPLIYSAFKPPILSTAVLRMLSMFWV